MKSFLLIRDSYKKRRIERGDIFTPNTDAAPHKRRGMDIYLLISCMAKHSKMSPSLMSLNFRMLMPHS